MDQIKKVFLSKKAGILCLGRHSANCQLSDDSLGALYIVDDHQDVAVLQSNQLLPLFENCLFYEVCIINRGSEGAISVGLAPPDHPDHFHPG